jgi:hypothetical protein
METPAITATQAASASTVDCCQRGRVELHEKAARMRLVVASAERDPSA